MLFVFLKSCLQKLLLVAQLKLAVISLSLSQKMPSQDTFHIPAMFLSVMLGFFYISYLYWIVYEYLTILCVYHPQYNTSFSLEFIFLFCKTASSSFHFLRYEFARHCWNIILSFYSNVIKTFLYLILNQPQDGRTKPRYYRP